MSCKICTIFGSVACVANMHHRRCMSRCADMFFECCVVICLTRQTMLPFLCSLEWARLCHVKAACFHPQGTMPWTRHVLSCHITFHLVTQCMARHYMSCRMMSCRTVSRRVMIGERSFGFQCLFCCGGTNKCRGLDANTMEPHRR